MHYGIIIPDLQNAGICYRCTWGHLWATTIIVHISLCLVILSAKLVNLKQLYLSKQVLSGFNEPTQSKLVLCVLLKLYMYFIWNAWSHVPTKGDNRILILKNNVISSQLFRGVLVIVTFLRVLLVISTPSKKKKKKMHMHMHMHMCVCLCMSPSLW